MYPDCWKRKVKPSQAATSNSSQASPTFSGAIFARFNKKIKKTRDPHHPKAFSNDCTERGSKLKARKVTPGFIFRLSGAGQSPGLSPHPVFHPPSSPGSSFYPNELPITKKSKYNYKCKNFQTQIQRLSSTNTNTKTMSGMPATPTRLAPGHPLSFLSPVSPGFPSHLSPTLQVTNTNTD